MPQVQLVTGQAGSGKTRWLTSEVLKHAPELVKLQHQQLLAITRMHGSRRRVESKLKESCPEIRCSVTTIDGFALSILNRWRTALGYSHQVHAMSGQADFVESIFGLDADFARVIEAATSLTQLNTVKRIIGESYPLILIDEFQDCHGALLEFVKRLSECSRVLLAADDFQLLDTNVIGCPAVDWVKTLKTAGQAEIFELPTCRRTSVKGILDAAHALRDNVTSSQVTVPVVCCPTEAPAAWKIIDALVLRFYSKPWSGTTALICPSNDPIIGKVLISCDSQLKKRQRDPIKWRVESAIEEEQHHIRASLGLDSTANEAEGSWSLPERALTPIENQIVTRSNRFARLRGLQGIPHSIVARQVDSIVHQRRAYGSHGSSRVVTTVHGAKNREFDNVFVVWTYKLPPDKLQQRKLLYNAITRSVKNCMVLVIGNVKRAQNDPILSLLGPAVAAFPDKRKAGSSKKSKKNAGAV